MVLFLGKPKDMWFSEISYWGHLGTLKYIEFFELWKREAGMGSWLDRFKYVLSQDTSWAIWVSVIFLWPFFFHKVVKRTGIIYGAWSSLEEGRFYRLIIIITWENPQCQYYLALKGVNVPFHLMLTHTKAGRFCYDLIRRSCYDQLEDLLPIPRRFPSSSNLMAMQVRLFLHQRPGRGSLLPVGQVYLAHCQLCVEVIYGKEGCKQRRKGVLSARKLSWEKGLELNLAFIKYLCERESHVQTLFLHHTIPLTPRRDRLANCGDANYRGSVQDTFSFESILLVKANEI